MHQISNINQYSIISNAENDTYEKISRQDKENIPENEIEIHWEKRALRDDIQSVMSIRKTLKQNKLATKAQQMAVKSFLEGKIDNHRIFEFGCGVGRMTPMLARQAKEVVALDFSPSMIKRAKINLQNYNNVKLVCGKLGEVNLENYSFDLVFDSIVLLHILNPLELIETARIMKSLSNTIFLSEHTYESDSFPSSKFTILRTEEEYISLFLPYKLTKYTKYNCAGDNLSFMLFEK